MRNAVDVRREREREFHNKPVDDRWRKVEKFYDLTESSHALYHSLLLERCQGKRVLEYGCGEGSSAFLLAEQGAAVTGIDISDVRIEHAREQAAELEDPSMSFEVMDAEALAFRDSSFELICGTSIIHHLDLARAFSELRRVLTADGVGIFLEPLGHNPLINLYRARTPELRTRTSIRSSCVISSSRGATSATSKQASSILPRWGRSGFERPEPSPFSGTAWKRSTASCSRWHRDCVATHG